MFDDVRKQTVLIKYQFIEFGTIMHSECCKITGRHVQGDQILQVYIGNNIRIMNQKKSVLQKILGIFQCPSCTEDRFFGKKPDLFVEIGPPQPVCDCLFFNWRFILTY